MAERAQLVNIAAIFVSPDLRRTAEYYRDVFGFEVVEHYLAPSAGGSSRPAKPASGAAWRRWRHDPLRARVSTLFSPGSHRQRRPEDARDTEFVALYRDSVEIVVVQAKRGQFESNSARYGAGYDAYLDPENVAGVDSLYAELRENGARIVSEPAMTPYGCYEFVVEDIDGRQIGIGRVKDEDVFFKGRAPRPSATS